MKKFIIFLSMILSIIFVRGCSNSDIVGNTDEEIFKYLSECNYGENDLAIVETVYIDNSKIVGFISDAWQGYMVYEKNKKGNYIMTNNMAQGIGENSIGATNFIFRYNLNSSKDIRDIGYLVISDGSNVSSVEMSINNHVFNETMEIGKPSMVLVKDVLSESELNETITFDCKYFDSNNNELKSEEF